MSLHHRPNDALPACLLGTLQSLNSSLDAISSSQRSSNVTKTFLIFHWKPISSSRWILSCESFVFLYADLMPIHHCPNDGLPAYLMGTLQSLNSALNAISSSQRSSNVIKTFLIFHWRPISSSRSILPWRDCDWTPKIPRSPDKSVSSMAFFLTFHSRGFLTFGSFRVEKVLHSTHVTTFRATQVLLSWASLRSTCN